MFCSPIYRMSMLAVRSIVYNFSPWCLVSPIPRSESYFPLIPTLWPNAHQQPQHQQDQLPCPAVHPMPIHFIIKFITPVISALKTSRNGNGRSLTGEKVDRERLRRSKHRRIHRPNFIEVQQALSLDTHPYPKQHAISTTMTMGNIRNRAYPPTYQTNSSIPHLLKRKARTISSDRTLSSLTYSRSRYHLFTQLPVIIPSPISR